MIDRSTIERIIDAAKVEEVVSDFVALRKRGINLIGLCPFHDEKTPSWFVSFPRRKNTVVHSFARKEHLEVFRMWQGRQPCALYHGARAAELLRGFEVARA